MVFADLGRTTSGVSNALEDMNLGVVAALAVFGAGGAFVAQEAVDLVFPQFGFNSDPTTPSGLGIAAAFKVLVAIVLVAAAGMLGGRVPLAVAGALAFGVLVHAGLDMFDMAQRGGIPGTSPRSTSTPSKPSPSNTASASVQTARPARASTSRGPVGSSSPRSRRKEMDTWG